MHRIADMMLAPAMVMALLDHPSCPSRDMSFVRHVRYGPAPASEAFIERVRERVRAALKREFGISHATTQMETKASTGSAVAHA